MIVIGIKANGEHLNFEMWAYNRWRMGAMQDPTLKACLDSCVKFFKWY